MKVTVNTMIKENRRIIAECDASEEEVYEALVDESEGWRMRLEELEDDDEEDDE